jgi:hypothetical protein
MKRFLWVLAFIVLCGVPGSAQFGRDSGGPPSNVMDAVNSGDLDRARDMLRQSGMLEDVKAMLANAGQLDSAREMFQRRDVSGLKAIAKEIPPTQIAEVREQLEEAGELGLPGSEEEDETKERVRKTFVGRYFFRSPYVQLFFAISILSFFLLLPYAQIFRGVKYLLGVKRKGKRKRRRLGSKPLQAPVTQ